MIEKLQNREMCKVSGGKIERRWVHNDGREIGTEDLNKSIVAKPRYRVFEYRTGEVIIETCSLHDAKNMDYQVNKLGRSPFEVSLTDIEL